MRASANQLPDMLLTERFWAFPWPQAMNTSISWKDMFAINGAFNAILSAVHLESLMRNWLSDEKIVNYVLTSDSLRRSWGRQSRRGEYLAAFQIHIGTCDYSFCHDFRRTGLCVFHLYPVYHRNRFKYSNFGLAAAMAVAIMAMIALIYVIQNKIIHGLILKERKTVW